MNKINIVIPMAGAGSRFRNAGYKKSKPFIEFSGKPMIINVINNLRIPNAYFILIVRKRQLQEEGIVVKKFEKENGVKIICIEEMTEGTLCTVLYARKFIDNETPLLIANSDQIVDVDIGDFIQDCISRNLDGSILTFYDRLKDPKWSFVQLDQNRLVKQTREKKAISNLATVGIYFFSKGYFFINSAIDMIARNERVNNEFYVCPVYNYMIRDGQKIGTYTIKEECMHGVGTPEDLEKYIRHLRSK